MSQDIIRIGIDLGTTNSEVAVFVDGKAEIVKNIYQDSFTPSVFGADKGGNKVVGKKAYESLFKKASPDEVENNKAEVKRLMGTSDKIKFPRLKKSLSAEEISAEILKSLKEDIGRKYPEIDTRAAVITVPAYFSILQSEATKRAGNLAGFEHVVLLQEPIAAALSYGFQTSENQNCLVYDLGGGTFDVAVISSREGSLTVLETGGDNFLGGKNIDWAIVEKVIVPEIIKKYQIKNFTRSNSKYGAVFSRLKYLAENAKIELSQIEKTLIEVDLDVSDSLNISLNIELDRPRFDEIIENIVKKTTDIAREAIASSGLTYETISKIILVGGPTQIPYIRKRIEEVLKIKVDTTIDCLTAVATGACVYGLSQRVPESVMATKEKNSEAISLKLNYPTLTSEEEEPIAGSIQGKYDEELTLQIQSDSGLFTSPMISLKNGKFIESITIEPNKTNQFWLYLFDSKGNSLAVEPDSFSITHGLSVTGSPISHTIGLAIQKITASETKSEFDPFFEKGSNLPLKARTKRYKTVQKISQNTDAELPLVIYEGESENPENNIFVCRLGISGSDLHEDLPVGTDVDVTISINESRELSASYYIPSIDLGRNLRITNLDEVLDTEILEASLSKVKKSFSDVSELCETTERENLENLIESAEESVQNSDADADDKRKANHEINEIRARVEKIAESKKTDKLELAFKGYIKLIPVLISNASSGSDNAGKEHGIKMFETLKNQGEKAISANNEMMLARTNEQLLELAINYYFADPSSWIELFERHTKGEYAYTNPQAAQYFIEKGKKGLEENNIDVVTDVTKELQNLRVEQDQVSFSTMVSGVTRY